MLHYIWIELSRVCFYYRSNQKVIRQLRTHNNGNRMDYAGNQGIVAPSTQSLDNYTNLQMISHNSKYTELTISDSTQHDTNSKYDYVEPFVVNNPVIQQSPRGQYAAYSLKNQYMILDPLETGFNRTRMYTNEIEDDKEMSINISERSGTCQQPNINKSERSGTCDQPDNYSASRNYFVLDPATTGFNRMPKTKPSTDNCSTILDPEQTRFDRTTKKDDNSNPYDFVTHDERV